MSSAATNFLCRHGGSLTSDEQGGFWLNYTVPGVEFGERVIERLSWMRHPLFASVLQNCISSWGRKQSNDGQRYSMTRRGMVELLRWFEKPMSGGLIPASMCSLTAWQQIFKLKSSFCL